MNKPFTALLVLLALCFQAAAQSTYIDYALTGSQIVTTTDGRRLNFFSKATGRKLGQGVACPWGIKLLTCDRSNAPVILDKAGKIRRYRKSTNTWQILATSKGPVFGMLWDKRNRGYLVTSRGIEDLQTGKAYFSSHSLNGQIRYPGRWHKPSCCHIDQQDRIWVGFDYGEWGGDLFVFQMATMRFLSPVMDSFRMTLSPVTSFFEDTASVYLTSGLEHMLVSGDIVRFDDVHAVPLLHSENHRGDLSGKGEKVQFYPNIPGEFIGPGAFSLSDSSIYFYSQNGIHRGRIGKDLSKIDDWKVILQPKLQWKKGRFDAVGSPMNVLKLDALGRGRLVLLSQNDGIAYYNGKELAMLE